jgi:phosphoserine phosphatase RsbU/P
VKSPIPGLPAFNVRMKILLIFLALSIFSLLVMGFAAFVTISDIGHSAIDSSSSLGNTAIRDSTAALTTATKEYMIRVASDQAQLIDEIFLQTEMEQDLLAAQALSVQNNPTYQSTIPSYPVTSPPPDPLAGTVVILTSGSRVSPGDEEYRALSGMDDLLAAVYRTDNDIVSVYVVSESGIIRAYPWENTTGSDFDPRTRPWFSAALATDSPVWTDPYVDASGHGLIITCSKRVSTRYGTWVVASDVTIDQLNNYTSMTLDGKGSAILIDEDGTVISSPGLSANGTRWDQPFPSVNVFDSPNPGIGGIGRNMTAGKTGLELVRVNNTEMLVAYAPVSSQNWSYAMVMPASEIVAPIMETAGAIETASNETSTEIHLQTDRLLFIFAGLIILLLLIVIILSWSLARIITRPVDALREGTAVIGSGDLNFRLNIRSGDEFEALADSFNQMASDLRSNIENLRRTTAEKERYTKELEIAKEIQDSFLPESVPDIPGFEVAAVTIPAMEIGGDLYDFIPVNAGRTGFVIADVSGKGVSAALYMALSRTLLHASGEAEADPGLAVKNANRLIYEDGRSSMFITVFYGVLDPRGMLFTYVNAGHNPPLLLRTGEGPAWMTGTKGIALGVIPEVGISPTGLGLRSGDVLVLYTDGVTEAFNERDENFGEERLLDCMMRHQSLPAKEMIAVLLAEIRAFSGSAPQSDDITLVVIRVV